MSDDGVSAGGEGGGRFCFPVSGERGGVEFCGNEGDGGVAVTRGMTGVGWLDDVDADEAERGC